MNSSQKEVLVSKWHIKQPDYRKVDVVNWGKDFDVKPWRVAVGESQEGDALEFG